MLGLLAAFSLALFAQDNAEFIKDVEVKRNQGYQWEFMGKQNVDPDIPHIDMGGKVYFRMSKE